MLEDFALEEESLLSDEALEEEVVVPPPQEARRMMPEKAKMAETCFFICFFPFLSDWVGVI